MEDALSDAGELVFRIGAVAKATTDATGIAIDNLESAWES